MKWPVWHYPSLWKPQDPKFILKAVICTLDAWSSLCTNSTSDGMLSYTPQVSSAPSLFYRKTREKQCFYLL